MAIVSYEDGVDVTITPPADGWQLAKRIDNLNKIGTAIYYIPNASSQSGEKIWGFSPDDKAAVVMIEYSGVITTSPLDVTASSSGASNSPNSGTTGTTSQNEEIAIAALVTREQNDVLLGPVTNGFVRLGEYDGGKDRVTIGVYEKSLLSTGTQSVGDTCDDNKKWVGAIVTFKVALAPDSITLSISQTYNRDGTDGYGNSSFGNVEPINSPYYIGVSPSTAPYAVRASLTTGNSWNLYIKGSGDFSDGGSNTIPLSQLSWREDGDSGDWTAMTTSNNLITAGSNNSNEDIDYKLDVNWNDNVATGYSTTITYEVITQ